MLLLLLLTKISDQDHEQRSPQGSHHGSTVSSLLTTTPPVSIAHSDTLTVATDSTEVLQRFMKDGQIKEEFAPVRLISSSHKVPRPACFDSFRRHRDGRLG